MVTLDYNIISWSLGSLLYIMHTKSLCHDFRARYILATIYLPYQTTPNADFAYKLVQGFRDL